MDAIPGTNTMYFIPVAAILQGCKVTYLYIICTHCLEKAVPHQVHWTVDGDCIEYLGDVSTMIADIITAKLLFDSVISIPGGQWHDG